MEIADSIIQLSIKEMYGISKYIPQAIVLAVFAFLLLTSFKMGKAELFPLLFLYVKCYNPVIGKTADTMPVGEGQDG